MVKDLRKKDFEKLNNRKGCWLIDKMIDKALMVLLRLKTKFIVVPISTGLHIFFFFFNSQLPVCRARQ